MNFNSNEYIFFIFKLKSKDRAHTHKGLHICTDKLMTKNNGSKQNLIAYNLLYVVAFASTLSLIYEILKSIIKQN